LDCTPKVIVTNLHLGILIFFSSNSGRNGVTKSTAGPLHVVGLRSVDVELAQPHEPRHVQVRRRPMHAAARRAQAGAYPTKSYKYIFVTGAFYIFVSIYLVW
jgi:hypothetical protein